MSKYDPDKVNVSIGQRIIGGFAEGTFVEVDFNEDKWSHYVGAQGDTTTEKNIDKTGTITLTVKSDSPSAQYLSSLAQNGSEVSGMVTDNNSDEGTGGWSGTRGHVERPTDSRGEEIQDIDFEIKFEKLELR